LYKIEKRPCGLLLTFSGTIGKAEMTCWLIESERQLVNMCGTFGVILDARKLALLNGEAQALMVEGQAMYKKKGMIRSAVAVANPMVTRQLKRLAEQSGIDAFERYVDTHECWDWAGVAVAWVRDGMDPDAFLASPADAQRPGLPGSSLPRRVHGARPCDPGFRIGAVPNSGFAGRKMRRGSQRLHALAVFRALGLRSWHCRPSLSRHCTCCSRAR
jgi:hypothetical protein